MVHEAATAPYKTRIVVYRPINPKRFDGTVVVEWLNVTAGIDAPATWLNSHVQMIRAGMAYIGVDAQAGGVNGESGSIAAAAAADGLRAADPARYDSLRHPGDSYSYSISNRPVRPCTPRDHDCSEVCTQSASWPWESRSRPSDW